MSKVITFRVSDELAEVLQGEGYSERAREALAKGLGVSAELLRKRQSSAYTQTMPRRTKFVDSFNLFWRKGVYDYYTDAPDGLDLPATYEIDSVAGLESRNGRALRVVRTPVGTITEQLETYLRGGALVLGTGNSRFSLHQYFYAWERRGLIRATDSRISEPGLSNGGLSGWEDVPVTTR